jgi:hypothetical protein
MVQQHKPQLVQYGVARKCTDPIHIWHMKVGTHQWKESIVLPIHKNGDKTEYSNYRGISSLPTSYKILSDILTSRLLTYADKIIWHHKCGF